MPADPPLPAAGAPTPEEARRLSRLGHDLRQPLQAAVIFQSLAARRNRDPALAAPLEQLGQALAALQGMLDQTLLLARLALSPEPPPPARPLALAPLLRGLVEEFAPRAEAAGLRLRLVLPADARALAEGDSVGRILRLWLDNALGHTRRGGVILAARPAGGRVRLQVWDSGCGIAPERRATLFAPWPDPRYQPAGGGLGLGLVLAGRLARRHGYELALCSRPGHGSRFELILPGAPGS